MIFLSHLLGKGKWKIYSRSPCVGGSRPEIVFGHVLEGQDLQYFRTCSFSEIAGFFFFFVWHECGVESMKASFDI